MKNKIREMNDEHAKVYDVVLNFPFYIENLNKTLNELPGNGEDKLYLDAGCGTGNLIKYAQHRGYNFIGLDLSNGMLRRAKEKGIKDLFKIDITHLPFRENYVDGITSVNVLYQLKEPKEFLKEAKRVLKPNGKLVILTPAKNASLFNFAPATLKSILKNPRILLNMKDLMAYFKINQRIINENPAFYTKDELEKILRESGFEIEKIEKAYVDQDWLVVARKPENETLEEKVN